MSLKYGQNLQGSDAGSGLDLRAKLSRVNKRAEDRAKRFGKIEETSTPGRGNQGNFNKGGFNKVWLKFKSFMSKSN